jgi:hypothetical protein
LSAPSALPTPARQAAPESRRRAARSSAEADGTPRPASLLGVRGALLSATRELFRLHASLDAQRARHASLDAEAAGREAALAAAEARFDEDALRFDTFLRDSDAALRTAQAQARRAADAEAQLARCAARLRVSALPRAFVYCTAALVFTQCAAYAYCTRWPSMHACAAQGEGRGGGGGRALFLAGSHLLPAGLARAVGGAAARRRHCQRSAALTTER